MAAKAAHKSAQDKAAKQKKLLIVLTLPLLLAVYYAYHTVTKSTASPSTKPPAAAAPAAASSSTAAAAPATATPSLAPTPPPDTGKLTSLALLPRRDPFGGGLQPSAISSATSAGTSSAQTPQPTTSQPKTSPKKAQSKTPQPTTPHFRKRRLKKTSPPPKTAIVVLDRTLLRVHLHKGFGKAAGVTDQQQLFWVVSLTHKTVRIIIVGQYQAHTLKVDKPLNLTDLQGTPHTLMLLPQGTPLPALATNLKTASPKTTTGG